MLFLPLIKQPFAKLKGYIPKQTTKIIFAGVIALLAIISVYFGLLNLIQFGVDCQIPGARVMLQGENPYSFMIPDGNGNLRWQTLLPQGYFLLSVFTLFNSPYDYLLYGIVSLLLLIFSLRKSLYDYNLLVVFLLMLCTLSVRNNLGNGQVGIFLFPFFILFIRLMNQEKLSLWNVLYGGLLLLILATKPSLYFWVPLVYLIKGDKADWLKVVQVCIAFLILQVGMLLLFSWIVKSSPGTIAINYIDNVQKCSWQMYDGTSFFNLNLIDQNYLAWPITILAFFFLVNKKIELRLFAALLLSMMFVYHREYDIFIILVPFLVFPRYAHSSVFVLLILMVLDKFLYVFLGNDSLVPRYFISFGILLVLVQLFYLEKGQTQTKDLGLPNT